MTPENLQTMHSPLEDYNLYFTEFAKCLDLAIENDDFVTQDTYSEFLDTHILSVIDEWLGKNPFYIFPTETDMEDEFNSAQMRSLINSLITHVTSSQNRRDSVPQHKDSQKESQEETQKETQKESQEETQKEIQKETQEETQKESQEETQEEIQKESQEETQEEPKQHITVESSPNEDSLRKPPELLWHYMSVPLMPLFMKATPFYATETPVQNIVPVQQNVEPPKEKQTSISTVARAMAHRRTIRSKKRTEMVRVKTRRSHPTL